MSWSTRALIWTRVVPAALGFWVVAFSVLGPAGPASAHVGITPSTTTAGAYAVLELSVPHGCEGSPTTEITVQVPEQVSSVVPTRNPLWQVEKQVVVLDPPLTDSHGNQVTERVESITYRADVPLPDGFRDTFELTVQLPDAAGTTLVLPTVQTCEQGEAAWIEVAQDGVGAEDLALPAPSFVLTSADDRPAGTAGVADVLTAAAGADVQPRAPESGAGGSDALTVVALGLGLLGAVMGGAALVRARRTT